MEISTAICKVVHDAGAPQAQKSGTCVGQTGHSKTTHHMDINTKKFYVVEDDLQGRHLTKF